MIGQIPTAVAGRLMWPVKPPADSAASDSDCDMAAINAIDRVSQAPGGLDAVHTACLRERSEFLDVRGCRKPGGEPSRTVRGAAGTRAARTGRDCSVLK